LAHQSVPIGQRLLTAKTSIYTAFHYDYINV